MTNFNKCERQIDDVEEFLAAVAQAGAAEVANQIPEQYKEIYLRAFAHIALSSETTFVVEGVQYV